MNDQQRAAGFRWSIFLAAFLILPNLALPLAARSLNLLVSGTINLDYPVIALLALFLSRRETFLLLLLAMIADFIHAASATYLFSPSEFLNSMRFGGMLSTARAAAILGTLAMVLLICVLTSLSAPRPRAGKPRQLMAGILLVPLITLLVTQVRSRGHFLGRETALARIPSVTLLQRQWIYDRYERGERLSNMRAMPSATAIALGHLRDSLVMVHESVRQMALDLLSRPTIFVVVGDHAPPFDRQEIRSRFSPTEVPYVILLPNAQTGSSLFGN